MRSSNGSSGVCSSDLCASKVCSSVDAKAACPLPAGGERRGLRPPDRAFLQPRRSAKAAPVLSIVCYDVLDCTRPTEARIFRGKSKRLSVNYRSEEHTSELQSLMRISFAVFCLKQ